MKLKITKNRKIHEIQKEFNSYFEYLKIEFCTKPIQFHEGFGSKFISNTNKRLGELNDQVSEKIIPLTCSMAVGELERIFQNDIGITVKVFRQSELSWHDTDSTNDWSLGKHNQYGSLLSVKLAGETMREFDTDMTRYRVFR